MFLKFPQAIDEYHLVGLLISFDEAPMWYIAHFKTLHTLLLPGILLTVAAFPVLVLIHLFDAAFVK